MSSEIIWNFVYPKRPDDLINPPTAEENRYHVSHQPRDFDNDHIRSDNDGLLRLRERFKHVTSALSLPGNAFDFLYNMVYYGDKIPITLSGLFVDTLVTISQTILTSLENQKIHDSGTLLARQYRTVIGMIYFLLIQHMKTLLGLLERNSSEMEKTKRERVVQKAQVSAGHSNISSPSLNQWGKELHVNVQKQLDLVLISLYLFFSSQNIRKQYEQMIIDESFVQFTLPTLMKMLTSIHTRQIFSHTTLPRSFNNLFLVCLEQYCHPEMMEISSIAPRIKTIIINGLVEMIKIDKFDPRFFINLIILGFSKFNISYQFSFFFEAILHLPQLDKVTLSELPKALKVLGTKLPARCLSNMSSLISTLSNSQSYSIRNSIVELVSSIITNAFVIPPDYHPGVKSDKEVLYYRPLEFNFVNRRLAGSSGAAGGASGNGMNPESNGDLLLGQEDDDRVGADELGDDDGDNDDFDGNGDKDKVKREDGDDDDLDDGDDDDDMIRSKKNSSSSSKAASTRRKLRYSMGQEDDDDNDDNDGVESNLKNSHSQSLQNTLHQAPDHIVTYDITTLTSVNTLGPANITRQALVELILQRLDDVHTEARTRSVQCLGAILLTTPLPYDLQIKCLSAVSNATSDRSPKVRKHALMLYRSIIQRNIHSGYKYSFSHSLNKSIITNLQVQYTQDVDSLKKIFDILIEKNENLKIQFEKLKNSLKIVFFQENNLDSQGNPINSTTTGTNNKNKGKNCNNNEDVDQNEAKLDNKLTAIDAEKEEEEKILKLNSKFQIFLSKNEEYSLLEKKIILTQNKIDKIIEQSHELRSNIRGCTAEINLIDQIRTLMTVRCLPLLRSLAITDVHESISCILAAFAAQMEGIEDLISELLSECTNPTVIEHVAETWGTILLNQHEQQWERDGTSQIFLRLILTILRLNGPAKYGFVQVFQQIVSSHSGIHLESTAPLHHVFAAFLRDPGSSHSSTPPIITTTPIAYVPVVVEKDQDDNNDDNNNKKNKKNNNLQKNNSQHKKNQQQQLQQQHQLPPEQPKNEFFSFLVQTSQEVHRAPTISQAQSAQYHQRFTNMLSFLVQTALTHINDGFITMDLPPIDMGAITLLLRALISNSTPIGPKFYKIFQSLLFSQHCKPQISQQILEILYNSTLILSKEQISELATFCINIVCFGSQIIAVPLVDSHIHFEQIMMLPSSSSSSKKNQQIKKSTKKSNLKIQGKKATSKKSRRGEDDDDDDDFDNGMDDPEDDDDNNNNDENNDDNNQLIPTPVPRVCIVTSSMVTTAMTNQAQATLQWTGLADICLRIVAKFTKNPIPIFEYILRHLSTVLNEIDQQSHFTYLLQHGPAFIPSICQTLSFLSTNQQQQQLQQPNGNDNGIGEELSLFIPTQCHCHSHIQVKATENRSITLPQNCSIFDPKTKLAYAPISQQERLTRLFTVTGFITTHTLLVIEDNEAKIRALTKKEVEANLHTIALSNGGISPSTTPTTSSSKSSSQRSRLNSDGDELSDNDDDDDSDDDIGPVGPTKRKATNIGRAKNKKARGSIEHTDDSDGDDSDDDGQGLLSRGGRRGGKKTTTTTTAKKAPTQTGKRLTKAQLAASAQANADAVEDEEERAGMMSRAEQHIEDNVKFIEKTLTDPNHYLGMAYRLINHVCVSRREFQPTVFYSALSARCKLMLISKDICRDAVPGLLSILKDLSITGRSLSQEYVITVKQMCAIAISDGAQRFPNECAAALDQLNVLATDRNEQVSIYSLHALASVLLTGMHKPNRALPYICTCLASEYPRIVSVARALVRTLGSKRDGNVSLIAISFPDILSRFLEGVTAKSKSSTENPLKVAKELLLYVKTEQEIAKVVKGITTRLALQLKNNIESSGIGGRGAGVQLDVHGQPIIETSAKLLVKKLSKLTNKFDRYRFTLGYYSLTGTKRNLKRNATKTQLTKVHSISFPTVVHLDLKADDVVNTTLIPSHKNDYCTCHLISCICSPVFKLNFDFITGDQHNLLQLEHIECLEDDFNIQTTSDSNKMAIIKANVDSTGNSNSNNLLDIPTGPTSQDFFERSKFLLVVLRAVKFNVSSARRFINDFNEYSQACQHPLLHNELKLLAKHIRTCVSRTTVGRPGAADGGSTKTGIEHDLNEWEEKIEEEYKKTGKSNQDDDDNDQSDDSIVQNDRKKQRRRMGDDSDDEKEQSEQEVEAAPVSRRGGGRRDAPAPAPSKKAPPAKGKKAAPPVPARSGRGGRRRPPSEEEESSSSEESSEEETEEDKEEVKPTGRAQRRR